MKHKKSFKDDTKKIGSLKKGCISLRKAKQHESDRTTESSYKTAECIAQLRKPFTDRVFIKEAFLSCADVLFDDLPDKSTIISRI